MSEEPRPRIDEGYYVNEATLEYLRLHLESQIRARLVKWVGVPVGAGGLVAVLLALFVWIPRQVEDFIRNSEDISREIAGSATAFIESDEGLQRVKEALAPALAEYFATTAGRAELGETVTAYLDENEGHRLVSTTVESLLESEAGRDLLVPIVNEALRPASSGLSERIQRNRQIEIAAFESEDPEHFEKGVNLTKFNEFLDDLIARGKDPDEISIAFTLVVGGRITYNAWAAGDWMDAIDDRTNLLAVVIREANGRHIACIEPEPFRAGLDDELIGAINESEPGDTSRLAALIRERFGPATLSAIPESLTVGDALRDDGWPDWTRVDERRAVIDAQQRVTGLVDRAWLIQGLLGLRPASG